MSDNVEPDSAVWWARQFTKACPWVPLTPEVRDVVISWFRGAIDAGYIAGYAIAQEEHQRSRP